MQNTQTGPKPGESAWLWLFKIISGLLIVVILVVHFLVNHFLPETDALLTANEVYEYYQNLLYVFMEGFFLVFVVSHSLVGMRSIFLDLNPRKTVMQILDVALIAIGAVSIVYGIWLLFAIMAQAPA